MEFLYFLEELRTPIIDHFMLIITQLGEETAFLVAALIIFWCVDKYIGYYILSVGFLGTLTNQFMKLWFRIPRPWIIDENFTILEQAREAASGYSFPSGHTQSAVGTFGAIAYTQKRHWIRGLAIGISILVPLSRMYIGVHTPLDVCVAAIMAILLVVVLKPIIVDKRERFMPLLLVIMSMVSVGYLAFVESHQFPSDVDIHNLESGIKNGYTMIGALMGLIVVYIVDERWRKFTTKAVWWSQCLKVALGLILVLIVKSGLKMPLNYLLGESIGRAMRYFLLVIVSGILWPMTFKWFSRIGVKE